MIMMNNNGDNRLKIIAPIPPSINNDYMKPRAIMKFGKPMAMMYESKVAKDYKILIKKIIKEEIKKQGFKKDLSKWTVVEWTFYFARVNQDSNNYFKVPVDSITELKEMIWIDDNTTLMRDKNIFYDSKNPRVELEIYYIDKIGIFDNQEKLDDFILNNCSQCRKGNKIGQKGGCSIYKKALENRIQEEINMNIMECNVKKQK